MQVVDDEMETIHLYVVRGEEKRPYTVFPLLCALLCLVGIAVVTVYSAEHPYYEHERLTVPATFLPLKVFTAEAPIIPTGIKTYPATHAVGTLTLTNGSVLSEVLPRGVIFSGMGGEVQTTESVFIPAGSVSGYGVATVRARTIQTGKSSNIQTLAVNAVYGTALYVRNLVPFSGGNNAYSVIVQLPKDRQTAINLARAFVASQKAQVPATLASPCKENLLGASNKMVVSWGCQFAVYHVPSYMRVLGAKLAGKDFLVTVEFTPKPQPFWGK
jgi:hypothetical protein